MRFNYRHARTLKQLGLGIAAAAVAGGIAAAVLSYRPVQRVDLGGGATVEWLGVTQGTNVFRDGSPVERLLGSAIPAGGLEIASIQLRRSKNLHPTAEADLTGWVVLRGVSVQQPVGG